MTELRERVLVCVKCPHLAASRKSVVFGVADIAEHARFWTDFGLPVESIGDNEAVFRLMSGSRQLLWAIRAAGRRKSIAAPTAW